MEQLDKLIPKPKLEEKTRLVEEHKSEPPKRSEQAKPFEPFDLRFPNTPKELHIYMSGPKNQQEERRLLGDYVYVRRNRMKFEQIYPDWDPTGETGTCLWKQPQHDSKWKSAHIEYTGGRVPVKMVPAWEVEHIEEGLYFEMEFPEPIVHYRNAEPLFNVNEKFEVV